MLIQTHLKLQGYSNKFDYDFGTVYCFENYVVGNINALTLVDTTIVKIILKDIQKFYHDSNIVYISDRQFFYEVDPSVYKLANSKKLAGIAIVGSGKKQRAQASNEQALYSGSFSFFENMDSAISWAQSFIKPAATG